MSDERAGLRLWVGGYPAPAGWDVGMAVGEGLVAICELAPSLARVSVPAWARNTAQALAAWAQMTYGSAFELEVRP